MKLCASRLLTAFVIGVSWFGSAAAQEFPSRPVKLVIGFGAGGLGDMAGRSIAQQLSTTLGKPVIVENMPGAGGSMAAASAARSAPDGHTMLWVSGQNAIAPSMFKSLPYDWSTDFAPVAPDGTFDFVIVVGKDSPLKTLRDVIDASKKNPDKFNFGAISAGSAQNLDALWFRSMAGMTCRRCRSAPPANGRCITRRQRPGGVRDDAGRHRAGAGRHVAGDRGVVRPALAVPAGRADRC